LRQRKIVFILGVIHQKNPIGAGVNAQRSQVHDGFSARHTLEMRAQLQPRRAGERVVRSPVHAIRIAGQAAQVLIIREPGARHVDIVLGEGARETHDPVGAAAISFNAADRVGIGAEVITPVLGHAAHQHAPAFILLGLDAGVDQHVVISPVAAPGVSAESPNLLNQGYLRQVRIHHGNLVNLDLTGDDVVRLSRGGDPCARRQGGAHNQHRRRAKPAPALPHRALTRHAFLNLHCYFHTLKLFIVRGASTARGPRQPAMPFPPDNPPPPRSQPDGSRSCCLRPDLRAKGPARRRPPLKKAGR